MTTLQESLEASAWQLIITIGRQRGLGLDANLNKAELIAKVTPALLDPANLNQALVRLPAPARQALLELQQAGGHCPARYLRRRHGQLRPASQLVRRQRRSTAQSSLAAFAPLEQLCLLGLVFLNPKSDDLLIPTDLLPLLPPPEEVSPPVPVSMPGAFAPVDLLCHDLAYLLALLQRDDISPLHGRWLPPRFLAEWGQCCAVPPWQANARSELQTGRRRFIHYLAESAGLLHPFDFAQDKPSSFRLPPSSFIPSTSLRTSLHPSPAAWLWLKVTRPERLQALWSAWNTPDPERWRIFRLPGHDWLTDPVTLLSPLHQALTKIDPADPAAFAQALLAQQPHLVELVPISILNPAEVLAETVVELLSGPFVWLGVLIEQKSSGAEEPGGEGETPSTPLPHSSPALLRLTPQGLAWLTDQPPAGDAPVPAKFAIEADLQPDPFESTLRLTLSDGLPEPADLAVAVELGESRWVTGNAESPSVPPSSPQFLPSPLSPTPYSLLLTPASFIRTLHRGWSAPALLDALNHLAERPLSGQETDLLRSWAEAAECMVIRHATILESADPQVITRLASTRRGRALIHRTLSPRAVVVDPARLDQLVRRLTEQEGVPPRVSRGEREQRSKGEISPAPPLPSAHSPTSYSLLLTACLVYQRLGQHLRLPVRTPQVLLDHLAALASPTDLAAADVAAKQVLADLRRALDGYVPFPPWPEGGLPEEESLAVIEEALAEGQNLRLRYYAAGTETLTQRVVEPYRVEWRGNTPYLIGFCHRAQAERMFRVDRVREIEIARSQA